MHDYRNFQLTRDARNVLTVALDVESRPLNVINRAVLEELESLVGDLEHDHGVRGVIFRSAKESGFLAGADLLEIRSVRSKTQARQVVRRGQQLFERVERLGIPTFAAIHGPCLGGGLEFALACRYRVARDDAHTRLGLPEVELGLLPAWGGTQRLPPLVGLSHALRLILTGSRITSQEALQIGLVDAAWPATRFASELERFVAERLEKRPRARRRGLFSRLRDDTRLGRQLVLRAARQQTGPRSRHYPALAAALECVAAALRHDRAAGLACEEESLANLLFTPTCRHLLAVFFATENARKPSTWAPHQVPPYQAPSARALRRIAVIGAGVMGTGIAQLAALQGLSVLLIDIDSSQLAAAMQRVESLNAQAVRKGLLSRGDAETRLRNIQPVRNLDAARDVDLAIEAVSERWELKQQIFAQLDGLLDATALMASNTSALSIGRLAAATRRPERVAGLHFFNPVHRMRLVEVVRTSQSSEGTIAALVALARTLGKVPIVVADRPGFLANRILFPYLEEAVRMVCEGLPADRIDASVRSFGMPMGPLELLDQVGIDVAADIAGVLSSLQPEPGPAAMRLIEMAAHGALGRKTQRGFYAYRRGGKRGRTLPWRTDSSVPRSEIIPPSAANRSPSAFAAHPQLRLVYALINEAARAVDEEIVPHNWAVDLGMVLGTGFAPFRGGPLHLADQIGVRLVVEHLERLAEVCGPRYQPCSLLKTMSRQGDVFYPDWDSEPVALARQHELATRR